MKSIGHRLVDKKGAMFNRLTFAIAVYVPGLSKYLRAAYQTVHTEAGKGVGDPLTDHISA